MINEVFVFISILSLGFSSNQLNKYEELEYMRSEYSSTYRLENGSYLTYYTGEKINYLEDGIYKKVNLNFKQFDNKFIVEENDYKLSVQDKSINIIHKNNDLMFFCNALNNYEKIKDNNIFYHGCELIAKPNALTLKVNNNFYSNYLLSFETNNIDYYINSEGALVLNNQNDTYIISKPYCYVDEEIIFGSFTINTLNNILNIYVNDIPNNINYTVNMNYVHTTHYWGYISDKYYDSSNNAIIDNNDYVRVGYSRPLLGYDFFNWVVYYNLEIDSNINSSLVLEAGLVLTRASGNLNSIRVKEISNLSYSNINVNSTYNTLDIGDFNIVNDQCVIDITDNLCNNIENNIDNIVLEIKGGLFTKNCDFYSEEEYENGPFYYVNRSTLGETLYGSAPNYVNCTHRLTNCMGYALGIEEEIDPFPNDGEVDYFTHHHRNLGYETWINLPPNYETFYYLIIPHLEEYFDSVNIIWRKLPSYQTDIYSNERRIAFRINNYSEDNWNNNHNFSDFHFIMQVSDGTWASTHLDHDSSTKGTSLDPTNDGYWQSNGTLFYNSPIIYYAISDTWSITS